MDPKNPEQFYAEFRADCSQTVSQQEFERLRREEALAIWRLM